MPRSNPRGVRIIAGLLLLTLCLTLQLGTADVAARQLVILNWPDYLAPSVISRFEKEFNAEVVEVHFDSDEHRTQALLKKSKGYDLILVSNSDLAAYARKGWISRYDPQQIPNLKHLDPKWQQAFPSSVGYGVPYFWGSVGILYRGDLVDQPITQWRQLFKPSANLAGRINMIHDGRELISIGLKSLGYSINSTDPAQLAQVEQLLLEQVPMVKSYRYLSLKPDSAIIRGDIHAAVVYNGDALMLQRYSDDLIYTLPDEGSYLWVDYFSIGAQASNTELAHQFINFINRPEIAAEQANHVHYASPNRAALKLLPPEYLSNPTIFPTSVPLENSEFLQPISAESLRQRNAIGAKILP
ncbi:spermidine/putrescine ABC transporter substrate-binding protein [Motiliproteus coralliicola]|uniref:Putrescine-binding periplasmic protein n=1 Tax=Motiliproteus coralliicola TaxID=2283196 RepID=A0A369WR49_9GAMM|nr:spermidine/putrescine ABC transporter substrate-binding protein [Motiliproteus coralliicola]RDE24172.1 spermidine/putrescine ABC transporter substrate-binding protein [Motiliproteus coralliicola]